MGSCQTHHRCSFFSPRYLEVLGKEETSPAPQVAEQACRECACSFRGGSVAAVLNSLGICSSRCLPGFEPILDAAQVDALRLMLSGMSVWLSGAPFLCL